jgi:hypothetical protein
MDNVVVRKGTVIKTTELSDKSHIQSVRLDVGSGSSLSPVSGTLPISGTVTATGPLTDAQLRASAVPVSGPLTDAQLRAEPVDIEDGLHISRGLISGYAQFRKFGANSAVGTPEEPISLLGTIWQPVAATALEVISSDATDTAAGVGARTVVLTGLNESWVETSETVTLAGASASTATTTTFIRLYRAYVATTGTYAGTNVGTLTFRIAGAGATVLSIGIGLGQTQTTHYTVPAGKTLYVEDIHLSVGSAKAVDIKFFQFPNADDVTTGFTGAKRLVQLFDGILQPVDFVYQTPLVFPAKTDLWFTGIVGTGSGSASIEYCGVLITA